MMRHATTIALTTLLAIVTLTAAAQEISDVREEYVVVEGDTLRGITKRFLGTELLWRENWRLNPQIADPDKLRIGERLMIITSRTIEAERAAISEVVREVDKTLQNRPWTDALVGDELGERDGIRTLSESSATLQFNNETQLRLDEYSQVFLTARETDVMGIDRGTIEIVEGSAGVVWEPISPRRPASELILVSGDAQTDLDPSAGTVSLRAETEETTARVSMYSGRGAVSAGGRSVALREGLGLSVPEGGVPTDPERLLRSPKPGEPSEGAVIDYDNPLLEWQSVDDAVSYRVEICADVGCDRMLYQQAVDAGTRVIARPVDAGPRFWRVAGVSDTGLVGYFSDPVAFEVSRDWTDDIAPGIVVTVADSPLVSGPAGSRIRADASLTFRTHDDASGVAEVVIAWDEESMRPWDGEPLTIPAGARMLHYAAVDRLGNRSSTHVLNIERDES